MTQILPVLGIEDDVDDTESIIDAFRKRGIADYLFFPEPGEFFAVFNDSFRVVVIDYNLPGMNGQQVLDRILKICKKCRAIIISGVITQEMYLRLQIIGAKDFVIKKENWTELLADKVQEQLKLANEELEEERIQAEENEGFIKSIKKLLGR